MTAAEAVDIAAANGAKIESGMIRAMVRLLVLVGCGAFVILLVLLPLSLRLGTPGLWPAFLFEGILRVAAAGAATWALLFGLRKLEPALDANAAAQTHFLDTLDVGYVDLAIAAAAALSLFLELAMIRWQSSVLEFLAFYKNFSLLACLPASASATRSPRATAFPCFW